MKRVLRSIIAAVVIAVAIVSFTTGLLAPHLPPVAGRPVVDELRTLPPCEAQSVILKNEDGGISVRAEARNNIQAVAEVRVYALNARGKEHAAAYAADLADQRLDNGRCVIASETGERPDDLYVTIDYTLHVPAGADVEIHSANGDVYVGEGCGAVRVTGRNADIEVHAPDGPIDVDTMNGRIRVVDAAQETRLETVNGSIYAHMAGGGLWASTVNGAIIAHVLDPAVRYCELTSPNRGITLAVYEGCCVQVDATTAQGVIWCDLPIDTSAGVRTRRHLKGAIGDGETRATLNTLNGSIWIARGKR